MSISLTPDALNYTWQQLARRALGAHKDSRHIDLAGLVATYYAQPDDVQGHCPCIVVVPCRPSARQELLVRRANSLKWLSSQHVAPSGSKLPFDRIPVLFWGAGYEDGHKPFAERRSDGSVVFYADIIAAAFFMLSRWEETVVPDRDQHGRFPATASVAYKQGFLDRPIVDEYALILREWLKVLLPGWKPKPRTFSVKLSHDIDRIYQFQNWCVAARTIGGDLFNRRSPARAWRSARDALAQAVLPAQTDYVRKIYYLADLSREYGLDNDAFYFMVDGPDHFGCGYPLTLPVVSRCIKDLQKRGFEIGLHSSYDTFQHPERLAEEKARLDAILGETHYGGRQHFLRFQAPDTWRYWEQVGLAYDSTLTYADHEGFRCGTCHPFQPFDVERDHVMDLWEVPLIVMDGTLRDYRQLAPEPGVARILALARRCQQVEGMFTLLWHNSSLGGEWKAWGKVYPQVVRILAKK